MSTTRLQRVIEAQELADVGIIKDSEMYLHYLCTGELLPERKRLRWWQRWWGFMLGLACVAVAAVLLSGCGGEVALAPAQLAPETHVPVQLVISHSDTSFAKEYCTRRGLTWSRLELSEDGSQVGVVCESEAVVRAQIAAKWEQVRRGR